MRFASEAHFPVAESASCNKRQLPRDALVVQAQLRAARNDNCVKGALLGAGYQPGL